MKFVVFWCFFESRRVYLPLSKTILPKKLPIHLKIVTQRPFSLPEHFEDFSAELNVWTLTIRSPFNT
jgi:hypothetical protein